jgi:hypothetical protein
VETTGLALTVTLGDLLTIGSIIVGTLAIYTRLIERLVRIETKTDLLWGYYASKSDAE